MPEFPHEIPREHESEDHDLFPEIHAHQPHVSHDGGGSFSLSDLGGVGAVLVIGMIAVTLLGLIGYAFNAIVGGGSHRSRDGGRHLGSNGYSKAEKKPIIVGCRYTRGEPGSTSHPRIYLGDGRSIVL